MIFIEEASQSFLTSFLPRPTFDSCLIRGGAFFWPYLQLLLALRQESGYRSVVAKIGQLFLDIMAGL